MNLTKEMLEYTDRNTALHAVTTAIESKAFEDLAAEHIDEPRLMSLMFIVASLTLLHPNGRTYVIRVVRPKGEGLEALVDYFTVGEGGEDKTREDWIEEQYGADKNVRLAPGQKVGHLEHSLVAIRDISLNFYREGVTPPEQVLYSGINELLIPSAEDMVHAIIGGISKLVFSSGKVVLKMSVKFDNSRTKEHEPHYCLGLQQVAGSIETFKAMRARTVLVPVKREADNGNVFAVTFLAKGVRIVGDSQTSLFYSSPDYTYWSADTAAKHIFEFLTEGIIDGTKFD